MHSCLARFCKNYVGASLFRFLTCLISRSASTSSSDWSAASYPRRDKLLSVRVPCLRGVVCVVTRGWARNTVTFPIHDHYNVLAATLKMYPTMFYSQQMTDPLRHLECEIREHYIPPFHINCFNA